jgi:adenylate cyclase class 2
MGPRDRIPDAGCGRLRIHCCVYRLRASEAIGFEKRCQNYEFEAQGRRMLASVVRVPEIDGTSFEVETLVDEREVSVASGLTPVP